MQQKNSSDQLNQSLKIGPNIKYLRLVILLSLLIGTLVFYKEHDDKCRLLFLTELGRFTTIIYFLLVCIENFIVQGRSIHFQKVVIGIYVSILSVEAMIVVFYWTVLSQYEYHKFKRTSFLLNNIFIHFYVCMTLQVDNIFNTIRLTKKQLIFPHCYCIVYGIFNCCYTLTVHIIYPPLKWTDLMTYVYLLVVVIIITLFHLLFVWIQDKYKFKQEQKEQEQQSDKQFKLLVNE